MDGVILGHPLVLPEVSVAQVEYLSLSWRQILAEFLLEVILCLIVLPRYAREADKVRAGLRKVDIQLDNFLKVTQDASPPTAPLI